MLPYSAKDVLVIRSASQYALLQTLDALREDAGAERFGILAQPNWLEAVSPLGRVHRYPENDPFRADQVDDDLLAEIRAVGYELAVAVYATSLGIGYANVDALLERLPVPIRFGYDAENDDWLELDDPEARRRRRAAEDAEAARVGAKRSAAVRIRRELGR